MDKVLSEIKRISLSYKAIQKVILFGSRARGDHNEKSDIDLAVYADGEISGFRYDLETKIPTLLEFDITKMTEGLDPAFLEQVAKEGIVIYEKSGF